MPAPTESAASPTASLAADRGRVALDEPRAERTGRIPLPSGVFTLSLDFELAWGSRDIADRAELERTSRITRDRVVGGLLELFERYGIAATWCTVGHLFLEHSESSGDRPMPDLVRPCYPWVRGDWLEGVPVRGSESTHPWFFGRSLLERILRCRVAQEIGSHSFTHLVFDDPGCSRQAADSDLAMCVAVAAELGLTLDSFVFPRNRIGHLDIVARHGFRCYRGVDHEWFHRPWMVGPTKRMAHLATVAAGLSGPVVWPEPGPHGLWNIPGSMVFLPYDGVRRMIPLARRVRRAVAGLDAACAARGMLHLWLHPINFAAAPDAMLGALGQILEAVARRRDTRRLTVMTMGQVAAHAAEHYTVGAGTGAVRS